MVGLTGQPVHAPPETDTCIRQRTLPNPEDAELSRGFATLEDPANA